MADKKEVYPLKTPFTLDQRLWIEDKISNIRAVWMVAQKRTEDLMKDIRLMTKEDKNDA